MRLIVRPATTFQTPKKVQPMKVAVHVLHASLAGLFGAAAFAQGPLAPPGAPAPTMKTLQQIEPRIPITNLPFQITQLGHYYLTDNLLSTSTNPAIRIETYGYVTIDLNGFALSGSYGGSGHLIYVNPIYGSIGVTVRNGTLWGGDSAVYAPGTQVVTLEDLRIRYAEGTGAVLGPQALVSRCVFIGCGLSGPGPGLVAGPQSRVVDSLFTDNQGHGLSAGAASVVEGCSSFQNKGSGLVAHNGSIFRNCAAYSNESFGVYGHEGSLLENLTLLHNQTGAGVQSGSRISGSTIRYSTQGGIVGDDDVTVERTTVHGSGEFGVSIRYGGTVRDCVLRANQHAGLRLAAGCVALDNVVDLNGFGNNEGGIHVAGDSNRVEGNQITSNADKGIWLAAAGNAVFKNSLRGNATPIDFVFGNDVGPQESAGSSTSPWANVVY